MHFGYAETEVGRELRCFGKTELKSRYAFLDRQCIQMCEYKCGRRFGKEWLIELEWLAKKYSLQSAGVVHDASLLLT